MSDPARDAHRVRDLLPACTELADACQRVATGRNNGDAWHVATAT
jgi:hypothetical protein